MKSHVIDLDGPLHYADYGGEGQPLVLVHGLGGHHLNWLGVAPRLAERARVVAPDLAGFGRTPPSGRSSSIRANRVLLDRFIDELFDEPVILVGNSMGGLISLMQTALRPDKVAGLVLVDPALPRTKGARPDALVIAAFASYGVPGIGERFVRERARRLGPEGLVRETLRICTVDPSRVPQHVYEAHVELSRERLTTMDWAHERYLEAARSLLGVLARKSTYHAMVRQVRAPTLMIHGARDRLVPLAAAYETHAVRPDWVLEVFDDIGHTPQLEAPERFVETVSRWLDDMDLLTETSTAQTTPG